MPADANVDLGACRRFLDPDGVATEPLPAFATEAGLLRTLYAGMVRARTFDAKAVALQRTGRLGTFASCLGQEAIGVGIANAMVTHDVLLPSFREHAAQLMRGVSPQELLLYWGGDERGSDFADPRQDFPVCIPVGTQFPHAAGVALAMQINDEPGVAVAVGGDGSTSKGDFYEALNVVGLWRLPAVFVINNNQWAISVPRREQTAAQTLAQKAVAAGMPGEQVDGNDVIAVRDSVGRALERARAGEGGTLIECLSYRLSDHTTADDASRYREDDEVRAHWAQEPLARLRKFLSTRHGWSKDDEEGLLKTAAEEIEAATEAYLQEEPEPAEAMFRYLFQQLPDDTVPQRDGLANA